MNSPYNVFRVYHLLEIQTLSRNKILKHLVEAKEQPSRFLSDHIAKGFPKTKQFSYTTRKNHCDLI